jgi:hypothetical protein
VGYFADGRLSRVIFFQQLFDVRLPEVWYMQPYISTSFDDDISWENFLFQFWWFHKYFSRQAIQGLQHGHLQSSVLCYIVLLFSPHVWWDSLSILLANVCVHEWGDWLSFLFCLKVYSCKATGFLLLSSSRNIQIAFVILYFYRRYASIMFIFRFQSIVHILYH